MPYADPQDPRRAEASQRYYARNKRAYLERNSEHKERIKAKLRDAKAAPCTDCGQEYPHYVMDYDHVKGQKLASVSKLITFSWAKVSREIAKCQLVCANCHRQRTAERGGYAV